MVSSPAQRCAKEQETEMTALQISTLDTVTYNEGDSVKAFAIVERIACRLGAEGGAA